MNLTFFSIVPLIVLICAVYLSFLYPMVYVKRNHPCVLSRSPYLILIEGFSLLADSLMNILINTSGIKESAQCILGIMTTVSFHYLALVSLILRADRIRRFFGLYDDYFRKQEEFEIMNS